MYYFCLLLSLYRRVICCVLTLRLVDQIYQRYVVSRFIYYKTIDQVDWIIQYDPPDDPRDYIHRVGRTARGADGYGKAILFLMPEELGFLHYLKQMHIPLNKYDFNLNKIANVQLQLEKLIEKNYYLNRASKDAYRSYLHVSLLQSCKNTAFQQAYISHSLKDIFNVHALDLARVARAFGFSTPPKVDLNIKLSNRSQKRLLNRQNYQIQSKKKLSQGLFI